MQSFVVQSHLGANEGIYVGECGMGKLSASAVKAATQPGRYGDGDGLYLVVQSASRRSWLCRVQKDGYRRDFGLGSASKVSLALASERAREIRIWVEMGLDPLFERRKNYCCDGGEKEHFENYQY